MSTFDPNDFDVDAFLADVQTGDEFERIMESVDLKVPEGACPRCFCKMAYLNRVRWCGRCGHTEDRGTVK
jgi:ribosomal protein S27AE